MTTIAQRRFPFAVALALLVAVVAGIFFLLRAFNSHQRTAFSLPHAVSPATDTGVTNGVFVDPALHFSFAIPAGLNVTHFVTDAGETILVQSSRDDEGVQIYITPFTDDGSSITSLRVKNEAHLSISNAHPITVANVARGLEFENNSSVPSLHDAWFSYRGSLYQTSTWEKDAALLDTLLASWRFQL